MYYVLLFYIVHVYCVIYKKSFSLTVSLSLWGQPALSLAVESNKNKTKLLQRVAETSYCNLTLSILLIWLSGGAHVMLLLMHVERNSEGQGPSPWAQV